jgi:hypothetical protein
MGEVTPEISMVLLRVSVDPGHNGPFCEYKIDSDPTGFRVTLRISRLVQAPGKHPVPPPRPPSPTPLPLPVPEEYSFRPSGLTEVLTKDQRQVRAFLERLTTEFRVYELTDRESPYPFLHPTFYTFSFGDAVGTNHSFTYRIEAAKHVDARYRRLIEAFDSFFESRRVFDAFWRSEQQNR